jgi:hypothetical protein
MGYKQGRSSQVNALVCLARGGVVLCYNSAALVA